MEEAEVILPSLNPCAICNNQAEKRSDGFFDEWQCPRCGTFDYEASLWHRVIFPEQMVRLSGWVRDQNAAGIAPVRIDPDTARVIGQRRSPGLQERALRLLVALSKSFPRPDFWLIPKPITQSLRLQAISYSRDDDDIGFLFRVLLDMEHLEYQMHGENVSITVKGFLAAEAQGNQPDSAQGFVAMWFDGSMNDVWLGGFEPGIRNAGYRPRRIDKEDYVGGVSDEIMAQIRRSRFVVADYTGHRNGVYFEAGFAVGLGLRIIPTCRADDSKGMHFDIQHLNTLLWNTPEELADDLTRRIRAVIGAGPDAADPP